MTRALPQPRIQTKTTSTTLAWVFGVIAALGVVCLIFVGAGTASAQNDTVVSGDGVGAAIVGSTADELREQLGDDWIVSALTRVSTDFEGHVVSRNGVVVFRAVKPDDDSDALSLFIVTDPNYRTAEGVGADSQISAAAADYGDATLVIEAGLNDREFVDFADGPTGVRFRAAGSGGERAGDYADGATSTTDFDDNARIAAIWVTCTGSSCSTAGAGAQPEPTPTPEDEPTPTTEAEEATPTPEPTETAEPTATPTTEPTPTPEPTATPTPEPTEDATDDDDESAGSGSSTGGSLPRTGTEHQVMSAVSALLLLTGTTMVMIARSRSLGPDWLSKR